MAPAGSLIDSVRSEAFPAPDGPRPRSFRAGSEDRAGHEHLLAAGHGESPAPRPSPLPRNLVGITVLVVEDDEASADYFEMALRTAGAAVVTVSSAPDALSAVQDRRPDVVLSDIAMPGRDGYWLVREIRGLPDSVLRNLPIVATTAHGSAHSRERTLAAGFVDHLPKPVDPYMLCAAVARAAGRTT